MNFQVVAASAAIIAAIPALWWALSDSTKRARTRGNLAAIGATSARELQLSGSATDRIFVPLAGLVANVTRRVTPTGSADSLDTKLDGAGLGARYSGDQVVAARLVLTGVGLVGGLVALPRLETSKGLLLVGLLAAIGYLLPTYLIDRTASRRRAQMKTELPDAIDRVLIAVEAGLGLDAAFERVALTSEGPVADELRRALQDMALGVSRADALDALAARADLAELTEFVAVLSQAEEHGIPLGEVLRVQAVELREKRRQAAEEHAMKVPVKIVGPLVLCVLPVLFIILIGPGILRIADSGLGS